MISAVYGEYVVIQSPEMNSDDNLTFDQEKHDEKIAKLNTYKKDYFINLDYSQIRTIFRLAQPLSRTPQ